MQKEAATKTKSKYMQNQIQVQIEAPVTVEKFTTLFAAVHKMDPDQAKQMYEVEKFHFMRELAEKNIPEVTPISALGVFLDVVSNGLSFSPQSKHVYLQTRNVKSGKKDDAGKDIYENRLVYSTQPDGKIFQAQRAGSIDYVTKPVIVYEGDEFAPCTNEAGQQIIIHKPAVPRKSKKIIAGYVYVVFKGGHREPTWLVQEDIDRLKKYSEKDRSKWDATLKKRVPGQANELYTSNDGQIDTGFFGSKIINAALKNVRKSIVPSVHQVEDVEETTQGALPEPTGAFAPSMIVTPPGELQETETGTNNSQYEF